MTRATRAGDRALDFFKCWLSGGVEGLGEPVVDELLLRDADGSAIDWRLQARLQLGEKLPPLNLEGDGGQALNQYLHRRKVWMTLRDEAKKQGERFTHYSFRHRFAKGMHAANIPIANISEAMGRNIEVHLKSYSRFKPNATEDIVAAVNV